MSLSDKISNKAEELGGKAKEAAGNLTDDDNLRAEGKADQVESGLKGAMENVKDAVEEGVDKVKNAFKH
ncbi:CsbD family protein [Nocardia sp. NBC_01503]|uniref:CsbD family protein n=1 Tax=Nocardia sp. NBC_01503 TaxID=2975997 RepID=UPI002E7C473D|nr:CsbD family protein [Nocardia sp. NBC_01503]WTL30921.1 CsbD family protein [Nocardia sp. NBC_01503]